MSQVRVWVDGRLIASQEPAVAAVDHGFVVGDGVFEAAKVVDGVPFALSRHHARMARSARGLGLPPPDRERFDAGIAAVLEGNRLARGKLRYWMTGGPGPLSSDRAVGEATYVVAVEPIPAAQPSGAVVVVPWVRNERSPVAGLKTTSYAENVVALAYAQQRGASEALLANSRGELCEGTGSNVFVVLDGEVVTPPEESGLLLGITRGLLLEWAAEFGMPIDERALPMSVLREAEEVFLTSSTRDVFAVHAVDDRALAPGPVTARLAREFARRAAAEVDP